ncbi:MAG: YneF family protein [Anaerorhabdus sp.]
MSTFWASVSSLIVGLLVGGGLGFFFTSRHAQKQQKEQMNEKVIRAMYRQMGQKPSEAKIRAIMKSMGQ